MTALQQLLECAIHAAQVAGDYALANSARRNEVVSCFKHDVKLRLDVESQIQAEQAIRARFADHAILGEEETHDVSSARGQSEYEWIIDPIDGTVNFSHGNPWWCCSIAVRRGEEVVAGAVYAPALDKMFSASNDEPATLNGSPIHVSDVREISLALVLGGLDKDAEPGLSPYALFERIASSTQRVRIMGAAALDICHVACGAGDGYFEAGIYIWDIAAAGLIVQRAGGRSEVLKRRGKAGHRLNFMASNGSIHGELRQLVTV
jgi:myo-inositol-1(or 4)-monophosphatase